MYSNRRNNIQKNKNKNKTRTRLVKTSFKDSENGFVRVKLNVFGQGLLMTS